MTNLDRKLRSSRTRRTHKNFRRITTQPIFPCSFLVKRSYSVTHFKMRPNFNDYPFPPPNTLTRHYHHNTQVVAQHILKCANHSCSSSIADTSFQPLFKSNTSPPRTAALLAKRHISSLRVIPPASNLRNDDCARRICRFKLPTESRSSKIFDEGNHTEL